MPIKEILAWGMGIVAMLAITKGPANLSTELRSLQLRILKEASRTDN